VACHVLCCEPQSSVVDVVRQEFELLDQIADAQRERVDGNADEAGRGVEDSEDDAADTTTDVSSDDGGGDSEGESEGGEESDRDGLHGRVVDADVDQDADVNVHVVNPAVGAQAAADSDPSDDGDAVTGADISSGVGANGDDSERNGHDGAPARDPTLGTWRDDESVGENIEPTSVAAGPGQDVDSQGGDEVTGAAAVASAGRDVGAVPTPGSSRDTGMLGRNGMDQPSAAARVPSAELDAAHSGAGAVGAAVAAREEPVDCEARAVPGSGSDGSDHDHDGEGSEAISADMGPREEVGSQDASNDVVVAAADAVPTEPVDGATGAVHAAGSDNYGSEHSGEGVGAGNDDEGEDTDSHDGGSAASTEDVAVQAYLDGAGGGVGDGDAPGADGGDAVWADAENVEDAMPDDDDDDDDGWNVEVNADAVIIDRADDADVVAQGEELDAVLDDQDVADLGFYDVLFGLKYVAGRPREPASCFSHLQLVQGPLVARACVHA